tara:strand:+ start:209 stop:343 length:135 start_codon:yes stop_codon:yes gene_type:complete
MFDELTNQEDGDEGPKGEKRALDKDLSTAKWETDEDMDMFLDGP